MQDYEQTSPKLFTNILLGIVFGVIASLIAVLFRENTDKKLTYSMLGENIIYNVEKDLPDLKMKLLANQDKQISLIMFEKLSPEIISELKNFKNLQLVTPDISSEFVAEINKTSDVILFGAINHTDSKLYKQIKKMLDEMNKNILNEVLV